MTTPLVEGLLTSPYVGVAEFRAAPTWIDSDNLIPGGIQGQQDSELNNVLLRASSWADGYVAQRLGAHTATEQTRTRMDRQGRIFLHPSNIPVRAVTGLAYGADFQDLTLLSDLTQVWVEDSRGIVVALTPIMASTLGSLQFGAPVTPGYQMFVQYQYTAGYSCTTLSVAATAGSSTITVSDPTGLQMPSTALIGTLPGSTVRIWDPGEEEAATVTGISGNVITLSTPLAKSHAPGAAVSELPAEVRQGIICYAVALLMKEDSSEEEPFSGTRFGPSVRRSRTRGAGGGLVSEAEEWLERYKRTR